MRAIVQLRGEVDMSGDIADTLEMLNVHDVNHCTFVPETDAYEGMITKVNDYVAHGEPSQEVVATLLERRAEPLEGDADVDAEWLAAHTDYEDFDELAAALADEETTLREEGLSPALRLHPPRSGHDGQKSPAATGGQIGVHSTEAIDQLLTAMR
jgi:large subunit ribosomal protein L30